MTINDFTTNKVLVELRAVYGMDLIYPANEAAQVFAQLTGKKTLSKSDLNLIRALGFEVERVFDTVEV